MTTMVQHAVLEHNGKWPAPTNSDGFRYGQLGVMIWRSEFETEAKRLGYINGYRWGVEYPTNGKRPDLGDDVFVQPSINGINWLQYSHKVSDIDWNVADSFKISDVRYKPADTSYLNVQLQDHIADVSKMVANWQERGELPPVGVDCETKFPKGEWVKCKIICHYNGAAVYVTHDRNVFMDEADYFRPIRTERERVIEAAVKIYDDKKCFSAESFASELHKAGMLVLPPKKSDTKD